MAAVVLIVMGGCSAAGGIDAPTLLSGVYWGFDPGRLFLRIDPTEEVQELLTAGGLELRLELTGPIQRFEGHLKLGDAALLTLRSAKNEGPFEDLGVVEDVAAADVLEMAIPLSRLGLRPGTLLGLSLHLSQEGQALARVPRKGVIEVEIPGDDFGSEIA